MANCNLSNKTISDKDQENEILLLDDECDSHCLTNIFEIPNYLSFTTNKTFEKMTREKIFHSTNSINMHILEEITILMHQSNMIDLEKSLWTIYLKSGTANILKSNGSILKIWPTCIKSIIQSMKHHVTQIDDNICLQFVTEYLHKLNQQQKQIQIQLSQNKKQFCGYTSQIEEILQAFIQEHIQSLRLQYEYKIKLVELNYHESVLKHKCLQENCNEQQKQSIKYVLHRKYLLETRKQQVQLMKEQIKNNKLPKLFESISIPLPFLIHSLTNKNLREHLQNFHYSIMKQYKNKMIKIYIETIETQLQECQKLFDDEMAKFWKDQCSLPIKQRLNKTIINLIDHYFILLTDKIECLYNYKKLQQFLFEIPITTID